LLEIAAVENVQRLRAKKVEAAKETDIEENKSMQTEDAATTLYNEHQDHVHSAGLFEEEEAFKNIGTLILELGIVMHSIIVGTTLSNAGSDEFVTLLIALVFHQVKKTSKKNTALDIKIGFSSLKE
jgi:zinc transporter 1/2/3